ncbi:oxidoreductase [Mycobacterium sp. SM1]|uniref:PDR/VanB family oxidoreductase n=1 Tax=Mycobacterium sp. SM1 TaxID=2816243 RepID=UPI001BD12320|nr:PDR/VanB family oxidoreductase [Mycobacterium sp. SM1]MBS4728589.1 oxidoreductase [Mycobacterium sp. SM1]
MITHLPAVQSHPEPASNAWSCAVSPEGGDSSTAQQVAGPRAAQNSDVKQSCGLQTLRVERARREAREVISLRLVHPRGLPLPAWTPGAHIDVILPSGRVRQYSLCGDPADRDAYTVAVLREPAGRGGSIEIHDPALVGQDVGVSQPRNHFPLVEAKRYLFIAGGIGITPILPMVRAVEARRIPWRLVYGGRSRDSMAFATDVKSLGGNRVELCPQNETGVLDVESIVGNASTDTAIYCCGPEGLIKAVESACQRYLPPDALHVERFASSEPSSTHPQETGKSFEVELRRTGVVLHVPPDRSLLDVVREAVPTVLSSCEEGFCGACVTTVLDGLPEHHDTVLTDAEREKNDTMIICVGRAKSARLVLDL